MACIDYPCCGHESGDCPTIDSKGRERWRCATCRKMLPFDASSSLCDRCQKRVEDDYNESYDDLMDY